MTDTKSKTIYRIVPVCALILVFLLFGTKVHAADELPYDIDPEALSSGEYDMLVEELKDSLRDGDISSGEDVRDAISKAEEKYGVDIDDDLEKKAEDIIDKAVDLGIDSDKLADLVDDVYDNALNGKVYESADDAMDAIEKQIVDSAAKVVKDSVKKSIMDYIGDFLDYIKNMFGALTSLWKK